MVTQYIYAHNMFNSVDGWEAFNDATIRPSTEGGKVAEKAGSTSSNWVTNHAASPPNRALVDGVRYTLNGMMVRRDSDAAGGVTVTLQDVDLSQTYSEVSITVPADRMPVGKWVSLPNLDLPAAYTSGNFRRLDIEFENYNSIFEPDTILDHTIKHVDLYQKAQAPAGPQLSADFTFTTNYLDAACSYAQGSTDAVVLDFLWDFGDGTTSTDQNPYHTYQLTGTYTITLTVSNGVQADVSQAQAVTVEAQPSPPPPPADPPDPPPPVEPPTFNTVSDRLRLEVASDDFGTLRNLLVNPDGDKGGFGWVTPVDGSIVAGVNDPDGYTGYEQGLLYEAVVQTPNYFYSEPAQVAAGDYINACWTVKYVGNYYRAKIEFLDADFAVVGSSAPTGYDNALQFERLLSTLIPANADYARIRFDFYSDTLGETDLAQGWKFAVNHVMLATAPTAAELDGLVFADTFYVWKDILGPTHEIKVTRQALDVGTLSAVVLDPALDPAVSADIRPGNLVRVTVNNSETGLYENLFEGTITNAEVTYVGGTRITLNAVDAITRLAQTARPEGVQHVSELPYLIEGAGVPWMVNGSGSQVPTAVVVAWNDNASLLDQIAVTRDTALGYAWMDRNNVLRANDANNMPTEVVAVMDENAYSSPEVSFNTDSCINTVTVKWLRYTPATGDQEASTEEVTYGPYRDDDSIRQWGIHAAEFTIQGANEGESAAAYYASLVLAANASPVRLINSVQVPIRKHADVTASKALLDVYDKVQAVYSDNGTSRYVRVTGIEHAITPGKWTMKLSFEDNGSVAAPQLTPSPPAPTTSPTGSPTGSVRLVPTMSGVVGDQFFIKEIVPGVVAVSGYLDVDDADTSRRDTGMRIPAGMEPLSQVIVSAPVVGSGGKSYRYFFGPDGIIEFEQDGTDEGPFEGISAVWFTN